MTRLCDTLDGNSESCILPFLYIPSIDYNISIYQFCTHTNYKINPKKMPICLKTSNFWAVLALASAVHYFPMF